MNGNTDGLMDLGSVVSHIGTRGRVVPVREPFGEIRFRAKGWDYALGMAVPSMVGMLITAAVIYATRTDPNDVSAALLFIALAAIAGVFAVLLRLSNETITFLPAGGVEWVRRRGPIVRRRRYQRDEVVIAPCVTKAFVGIVKRERCGAVVFTKDGWMTFLCVARDEEGAREYLRSLPPEVAGVVGERWCRAEIAPLPSLW